MKKVIVSGGGTGGHIYPALTIIKAMSEFEEIDVLYIGTKEGLENKIVTRENIRFDTLEVSGFNRKKILKNISNLKNLIKSLIKSKKILKEFKPDIVIGTGGYVCGPILLMASILNIPTLIQEQNVVAGVTNKILSRYVNKIAVGYEESKKCFKNKEKIVFTGNPIRKEINYYSKEIAVDMLKLKKDLFTILITGGSRGAQNINNNMVKVHQFFKDSNKVQIIHLTGESEFAKMKSILKDIDENGKYGENSYIFPYLHKMELALAAADLIICRAGAIAIAELTACSKPAILIPYPYAIANHQYFNAKVLEDNGAAEIILDKDLNSEDLIVRIKNLMNNKHKLKEMASASKKLGRPEAAKEIAKLALSIAN